MKRLLLATSQFFERNSRSNLLARERFAKELREQERYADPRCLTRYEHQAFSQNGEDGAIREIFRRIGQGSRTFVEIGVGTGIENNTALLLADGWKGTWIEGSPKHCKEIRRKFKRELDSGQLVLIESFVTRGNVNDLMTRHAPASLDFFSLDIDMNTLHVWEAMDELKPRVCVIEYNATFPCDMRWNVEYNERAWWSGSSYFGASLQSIADVAVKKGYLLIGCDLTGTNAYFVRTDACSEHFLDPGSTRTHYEPSRTYLIGMKPGHAREFRRD